MREDEWERMNEREWIREDKWERMNERRWMREDWKEESSRNEWELIRDMKINEQRGGKEWDTDEEQMTEVDETRWSKEINSKVKEVRRREENRRDEKRWEEERRETSAIETLAIKLCQKV